MANNLHLLWLLLLLELGEEIIISNLKAIIPEMLAQKQYY